ncbi:MAG: oligosaccharide flippase family protein [Gemmatimonadota bacterium]
MTEPDDLLPGPGSRDIRDLARGTVVNLAGMVARVSRPLATAAATHLFGPAIFGLYDTGWKITFVLYKVARFGLQLGVARAVLEARVAGRDDDAARTIGEGLLLSAVVGGLTAVALSLAAGPVARLYAQPDLGQAVRILALALPWLGLTSVLLTATRALRIMRYEVYVHSLGGPLLMLLGTLLAGLLRAGLSGLAAAQVLAAVGMLVQSVVYFRRRYSLAACFRHLGGSCLWGRLARFSFPVMLSDVLSTAVFSLDQFVLLRYAAPASVGVYAVARQASTLLKKAPQAFDPIFGPIVAHQSAEGRRGDMGEQLAFVLRWTLTANLAYLGLVWLLGDRLLLVFGPEFARGAQVFWVLSLGMVAFGACLPLENLLVMQGHPYLNLAYNAGWGAGLLALSLWLIPQHGMLGAAWASTLSLVGVTLVRLVHAHAVARLQPLRWHQLKPFGAGAAAAAGAGLVRLLVPDDSLGRALAAVAVFLALYGLTLYLLGPEPEDRRLLGRLRERLRPPPPSDRRVP